MRHACLNLPGLVWSSVECIVKLLRQYSCLNLAGLVWSSVERIVKLLPTRLVWLACTRLC